MICRTADLEYKRVAELEDHPEKMAEWLREASLESGQRPTSEPPITPAIMPGSPEAHVRTSHASPPALPIGRRGPAPSQPLKITSGYRGRLNPVAAFRLGFRGGTARTRITSVGGLGDYDTHLDRGATMHGATSAPRLVGPLNIVVGRRRHQA